MTSEETWRNRIKNTNNPIMKNIPMTPPQSQPAQQPIPLPIDYLECARMDIHGNAVARDNTLFVRLDDVDAVIDTLKAERSRSRPHTSTPEPCKNYTGKCEDNDCISRDDIENRERFDCDAYCKLTVEREAVIRNATLDLIVKEAESIKKDCSYIGKETIDPEGKEYWRGYGIGVQALKEYAESLRTPTQEQKI